MAPLLPLRWHLRPPARITTALPNRPASLPAVALAVALLRFPDGELPSRRWRFVELTDTVQPSHLSLRLRAPGQVGP